MHPTQYERGKMRKQVKYVYDHDLGTFTSKI